MDEPPTEGRRRPQRKLTDDDKARLLEVLKRDDVRREGKIHVPTVCALTGLSYGQVYNFLRSDRYWHAQVGEADASKLVPTETDAIDPPPTPPAGVWISNTEMEQVQAILRQQRKMGAKDWEALGMDARLAERVESMSRMGKAPMLQVIGMLYGGLVKQAAVLDEILEIDAGKIRQNALPAEMDKEGAPVEDGKVQREWRYCWYAGAKLNLDLYSSLHKTQAILARAMRDWKALNEGEKPPEKGVFEMGSAAVSERKPDSA